MKVDGVNFSEAAIKKLTLEEFTDRCIGVFWKERPEETRKKILTDIYYRVHPKPKSTEKPAEAEV